MPERFIARKLMVLLNRLTKADARLCQLGCGDFCMFKNISSLKKAYERAKDSVRRFGGSYYSLVLNGERWRLFLHPPRKRRDKYKTRELMVPQYGTREHPISGASVEPLMYHTHELLFMPVDKSSVRYLTPLLNNIRGPTPERLTNKSGSLRKSGPMRLPLSPSSLTDEIRCSLKQNPRIEISQQKLLNEPNYRGSSFNDETFTSLTAILSRKS